MNNAYAHLSIGELQRLAAMGNTYASGELLRRVQERNRAVVL